MADVSSNRSVSIYIDTDAAERSAERLRGRIDKLRQTIEDGEKAGKDMTSSIERLGKSEKELEGLDKMISGEWGNSLKRLSGDVSRLRRELSDMSKDDPAFKAKRAEFQKASKDLQKMREETLGVNSALDKMKNIGLGVMGGLFGSFAISSVVGWFTGAIQDASRMAAEVEGVEVAFNRLNNPNLLNELRKATKGTVNDLELMKQAVVFDNFGLPIDRMAEALEFARVRAKETGESVDYLVNSIVTGIGRQSVQIMDNLGISAKRMRDEFNKVGNFAEAAFNLISEEAEKSESDLDTYAEQMAQIQTVIENNQIAFGGYLNSMKQGVLAITKDVFSLSKAWERLKNPFSRESYENWDLYRKNLELTVKAEEESVIRRNQIHAEFERNYKRFLTGLTNLDLNTRNERLRIASDFYDKEIERAKMYFGESSLLFKMHANTQLAAWNRFKSEIGKMSIDINTVTTSNISSGTQEELQEILTKLNEQKKGLQAGDAAAIADVNRRIADVQKVLKNFDGPKDSAKLASAERKTAEAELKAINEEMRRLLEYVEGLEMRGADDEVQAAVEVEQVIKKYAELIGKAKQYTSVVAELTELEKRELEAVYARQFVERSGREYEESLNLLRGYYDEQTMIVNQQFIDGEISQDQHEKELTRIQREELESRMVIMKDYAGVSEKAAKDLEGAKTAAMNQGVQDRKDALKEEARLAEHAQEEEFARLRTNIILAREGSKEEFEAKKELLREQFEYEYKALEGNKEAQKELEAEYNEELYKMNLERVKRQVEAIASLYSTVMNSVGSFFQALNDYERAELDNERHLNNEKLKSYKEMLDNKRISQETYDRMVEQSEEAMRKKELAFRQKEFRREKAMKLSQAVMSTAVAVVEALTLGPILGPIMAAVIGAMGAAQIGVIAATKAPKYKRGGIVKGASHEEGGISLVDSKSGKKVGEMEGDEAYMILSKKFTAANRDIIEQMLAASMSGSGERMNFDRQVFKKPERLDYGKAIETIHYHRTYKYGGVVNNAPVPNSPENLDRGMNPDERVVLENLTDALNTFNDRVKDPIKAEVVWTDLERKRKQYEELQRMSSMKL